MLVLGSFHSHLTDDVKKHLDENNINMVVFPGGSTSLLQHLDVLTSNSKTIYGNCTING